VQDPELLGAFYARLGHRQWTSGQIIDSIATLGHAADLCEACGNSEDAAGAYAILAWAHLLYGNYGRVGEYRDKALEKIEVSFHPVWYSFARAAATLGDTWTGDWGAAIAEGEIAMQEGRRRGDKAIVSFAAAWIAQAYLDKREWESARAYAELGLAEAPTIYFQSFPQAFLARAQCELGEAARGLPVLAEIERLVESSAHRPAWCLIASWLGDAYAATGEHAAARSVLERVQHVAHAGQLSFFAVQASRLLGDLAFERGDLVEATSRLAYAAELAEKTGARNEHGLAMWSFARLSLSQGDAARANRQFARAADILGALGRTDARDRILQEAVPVADAAMP
jgi:tetratricopeptide (TPR) repeat protein